MDAFPSAKHLCSLVSLTPTNNESTEKKNLISLLQLVKLQLSRLF